MRLQDWKLINSDGARVGAFERDAEDRFARLTPGSSNHHASQEYCIKRIQSSLAPNSIFGEENCGQADSLRLNFDALQVRESKGFAISKPHSHVGAQLRMAVPPRAIG